MWEITFFKWKAWHGAFWGKKIDGKDKTKSKTCNLYSSSVVRRMHDLNGLFKTLFAVISQYVLHVCWQAKNTRIYINPPLLKCDFTGFCCRLSWNIINMRKLELFVTLCSLCVSSLSRSWITSSLHPSWLCKERQPFLFPLQLTLENSRLFLDDFQSHFCPFKRKEEKKFLAFKFLTSSGSCFCREAS